MFCALIAPCFDKKLESAREELKNKQSPVNVVVSTEELKRALIEQGFEAFLSQTAPDLHYPNTNGIVESAISGNIDVAQTVQADDIEFARSYESYGEANGYADFIIKKLKEKADFRAVSINVRRPKKFIEISVTFEDSSQVLLALVYGFKNIQNMVASIKTQKKKYDYCEVMACPSGCVGGGGQMVCESLAELSSKIEELKAREMAKVERRNELLVGQLSIGIKSGQLRSLVAPEFLDYKLEAFSNKDGLKETW